jgi:hypothetical protein
MMLTAHRARSLPVEVGAEEEQSTISNHAENASVEAIATSLNTIANDPSADSVPENTRFIKIVAAESSRIKSPVAKARLKESVTVAKRAARARNNAAMTRALNTIRVD